MDSSINKTDSSSDRPIAKNANYRKFDLQKVEDLAAQGMSQAKIAMNLGVSVGTVYDRIKEDIDFKNAYLKGRARGEQHVTSKLMELIEEKNLGAITFYLKCQAGWQEKNKIEIENKTERQVVINLFTQDDLQKNQQLDSDKQQLAIEDHVIDVTPAEKKPAPKKKTASKKAGKQKVRGLSKYLADKEAAEKEKQAAEKKADPKKNRSSK